MAYAVAVLLVSSALGWEVPHPARVEHPGAAAAPASDPRTYPDAAGFEQRAKLILQGLATNDLGTWRRGYFTGGDPGKYLPGPAMAKLMLNPQDAEARKYMNDDRSYKEHYHFAAVNWGRFLPIFAEALTPETRQKLAAEVAKYSPYASGSGTENHKVMWMTSFNVLPWYVEGGRVAKLDQKAALAQAKGKLREYVKGLYAGGQGEWDSSTYLMFDVNGMLNVYDFSKDPEVRLIAKAALDWYMTAYALKYRDGVYTAPNQRGFAAGPVQTIADRTGWLWWGSNAPIAAEQTKGSLYTMHAVTSSWRPNAVITAIAQKKLPQLPFEQRNSKPNYWGIAGQPRPNAYQESVYNSATFTMASLWKGFGGQITRFQLVCESPQGGIVFTGGNPSSADHEAKILNVAKFQDGNGVYDQSAQVDGTYIHMSSAPEDAVAKYSFFSLPEGVGQPRQVGDWLVVQAGKTTVAVQSLGGKAEISATEPDKQGKVRQYLKFPGPRSGFVVQALDSAMPKCDLAAMKVDTSKFATNMQVSLTNPHGRKIEMTFNPAADNKHGGQPAVVTIDGKEVAFDNWPIYSGPYVNHDKGVLSVNDGKQGFVIDFTGDLPVYKAWTR